MTKRLDEMGITPAPWQAVEGCVPTAKRYVVDNNRKSVGTAWEGDDDVAEADARIMAAAPELYEALRAIMDDGLRGPNCIDLGLAANRALEKAGGAE